MKISTNIKNPYEKDIVPEQVQYKQRLHKEVADILNKQIEKEIYSSHLYKAMAAWLSDGPWSNAYNLFLKYGNEEQEHANKIIAYLDSRNTKIVIPEIQKPPEEFDGIIDILTQSLKHEIIVTENWEAIACMAKDKSDNTTYFFAKDFLHEQIEEEEKFRKLLYFMDLGGPSWYLDQHINDIVG